MFHNISGGIFVNDSLKFISNFHLTEIFREIFVKHLAHDQTNVRFLDKIF